MKTSIKPLLILSLLWILAGLSSCMSEGVDKIVAERDALKETAESQQKKLDNLQDLLSTVNSGLDSIASSEATLYNPGVSEGANGKTEILTNLDRLQNLVNSQKDRIAALESRLQEEQTNDSKAKSMDTQMLNLIANYKRQLSEKDQQIAELKKQLSQKDADISSLRNKVGIQSQAIAELDRKTTMQDEALKRQDAALNQCYMIADSKKSLQAKNIIRKGRLVTTSALDRKLFAKVDIRSFTEFSFSAKRPRILTPMPQNSYTLTTDGKGNYSLHISNPTVFWSNSNFLVIQTD